MKHTQSGKYEVSRMAGVLLMGLLLVATNIATGPRKQRRLTQNKGEKNHE
jgi:hypothetical protein